MDLIVHTPTTHDACTRERFQALSYLPETGFVRQPLVLRLVPFSKSTLWRRVGQGLFPSPIKLSVGITAWRAEDIRRWIDEHA